MEAMRRAGPGTIRTQKRMVGLSDYANRLEEHPLVERAHAVRRWGGSWSEVWVAVILWNDLTLDAPLATDEQLPQNRRRLVDVFHRERGLVPPVWSGPTTVREILAAYLERYRLLGQEVLLRDVEPIGVDLTFCLRVGANYFRSEVLTEARKALGRVPGGFFEPGRFRFGEDLHASDFYERLMGLDGVENVQLLVLKKVGSLHANRAKEGHIELAPGQIPVCDSSPDPSRRHRGLLRIRLEGGRRG
jgi:hypothetical protein